MKLRLLFIFVLVIVLANTSCEGPMGPQGPQGEQGPPGPVGPAGSDGSIIHAGQGAPDENTGKPGDFYLDLATGGLFGPKMSEGWGVPMNLHGPQGPPGEDGEDGQDGQDGEQGPQGPAGEDGQDGKDGSQIYAGNDPPASGLGKKGDYYLDKTSYDLYGPKTSSGWGSPVNLQGPKGDQGPQGPEGPAGTTDHGMLTGLSADDHTQYLLADGVRDATDGFAVTGTLNSGTIPADGEGTRLMWYPGKAAFRAGWVKGDQWDDGNVGFYSTAMGGSTTASGNNSTALGGFTTASGFVSTALGDGTTASGAGSTAMGFKTTASGAYSMAMGDITTASGTSSTAMGDHTTAASPNSLSIGKYNSANTTFDGTLFVAGNGSTNSNRFDALVLDNFGNLSIAGLYQQHSDRHLKTGIRPLENGALGKLGRIRPIRYHFKDSTSHPAGEQLGMIAQEVQEHFPELVSTGSDGYLSLSYSNFTAVLLKGIQEQQAEIEKQSMLIKQLRLKTNRVVHLEARLVKLEQQRPAHTVELTRFANFSYAAVSRWIFNILLLFICCLILWHHQVITKPTRS